MSFYYKRVNTGDRNKIICLLKWRQKPKTRICLWWIMNSKSVGIEILSAPFLEIFTFPIFGPYTVLQKKLSRNTWEVIVIFWQVLSSRTRICIWNFPGTSEFWDTGKKPVFRTFMHLYAGKHSLFSTDFHFFNGFGKKRLIPLEWYIW